MTEKYNTKNYKSGYSPSRLQHNYKMIYENAYNLAQDLNNVFNRLYTVEQEKKEYRKETERLQKELAEAIEQNQKNVYAVVKQANRGANYALKEVKKLEAEIKRLREALKFYAELDGNGIQLYGEMDSKALEFVDGASFQFGQTARDVLKGGEE